MLDREVLLGLVAAVPAGRVTSYRMLGQAVGASARDVASVLGTLDPDEADALPWHRVVGDQGWLGAAKVDRFGRGQDDRLAEDGLEVVGGQVVDFDALALSAEALTAAPDDPPLRRALGE